MNNKRMVTSKKLIERQLQELREKIFIDFEKMVKVKQYELEKEIILISFYYFSDENKITISLEDIEKKCKRREMRYRDIRYEMLPMVITEEHAWREEQFGFVAFTNHNASLTPIFAYNQLPKIRGVLAEDKFSWKVMEIGDYFRDEPIDYVLHYDVYYAMLMIETSERIPKTVFKDIQQDLRDLCLVL